MKKEFIRIIPTNPAEIKRITTEALAFISDCAQCEGDIFRIRLCILEALANSYTHGNQQMEDKKIMIKVTIEGKIIEVYIRDEGKGIELAQALNCDFPEWDVESGRGIPILKAYCDEIRWAEEAGEVRLTFQLDSQ